MPDDVSNGWDAVAPEFARVRSDVGLGVVRRWAASLPAGGTVLDVGAGTGEPLTAALAADGFSVFAVDASPAMVAAFRDRLPDVPIACEAAETSRFFDRTFDGVMAVGLVFLLAEEDQRILPRRMAAALNAGGRLLFSAPRETCAWDDLLTGRSSRSLGADIYRGLLEQSGLVRVTEHQDGGGNHYFAAVKPV
ncbi:MAG: class I SAM-dependent methyltransferase [Pseudomonadota bacterium]